MLRSAAAPGALHLYVVTAGPALLNSLSHQPTGVDESTAEGGGGEADSAGVLENTSVGSTKLRTDQMDIF